MDRIFYGGWKKQLHTSICMRYMIPCSLPARLVVEQQSSPADPEGRSLQQCPEIQQKEPNVCQLLAEALVGSMSLQHSMD